ncbi:MAG: hypothetical protein OXR64_11425 [Chloroflexota bacterium]|nr:hypothetical protein [Chloroflexota bacterium]MDE2920436.1 hypothetical protein [Chloroflexota bacterium]
MDAKINRRIQLWTNQIASAAVAQTSRRGLRKHRRFTVRAISIEVAEATLSTDRTRDEPS